MRNAYRADGKGREVRGVVEFAGTGVLVNPLSTSGFRGDALYLYVYLIL